MNADITIGNPEEGTFYGAPKGQRIRVKRGNELLVVLNDVAMPLTWGTTSPDRVLDLTEQTDPLRANIKTVTSGNSKVLLLNKDLNTEFYIEVEVFDPTEVTTLNANATEPRQRPYTA